MLARSSRASRTARSARGSTRACPRPGARPRATARSAPAPLPRSHSARQPKLLVPPRSNRAPDGPPPAGSRRRPAPTRSAPPHSSSRRSTIQRTVRASAVARAEVPRPRRLAGERAQLLRQQQVAAQRVQHVLPRPHGVGVAHLHRLARPHRAHDVADQPVLAPIPAADHVARARARDSRGVLASEKNERR